MSDDRFYKEHPEDTIWWLNNADETTGQFVFSFDRKKLYNMFRVYPHNMAPEEVQLFDRENPYWAEFFKDRKGKI